MRKDKRKPRHLRGAVCVVHSEAGRLRCLRGRLFHYSKVQQTVRKIRAVANTAAVKVAKWRVLFAKEQQHLSKLVAHG